MAAAQIIGTPTEQASVGNAFGQSYLPEEAKLEWFFSAGQSLFEASTFGALLERQSTFGQMFENCWSCNGSGFTEDDSSCPKCKGMGGKPVASAPLDTRGREVQSGLLFGTTRCECCIQQPRSRWACAECDGYGFFAASGACCLLCRGTGAKLLKSGKPRKRVARRHRPDPCWSCGGKRYHERTPVGLKAETHPEPSYTPDDGALRTFAQVSRWLMQCSDDTVDTLAEFFGLSGYLWGNTKWGRLFGIVPLTAAGGRTLAKLANPHDVADHYLLATHVHNLEKLKGHERERGNQWLELVTRQAAERFKRAVAEWALVVTGDDQAARLSQALRGIFLAAVTPGEAVAKSGAPRDLVTDQTRKLALSLERATVEACVGHPRLTEAYVDAFAAAWLADARRQVATRSAA